jgi:hypothetical protein
MGIEWMGGAACGGGRNLGSGVELWILERGIVVGEESGPTEDNRELQEEEIYGARRHARAESAETPKTSTV